MCARLQYYCLPSRPTFVHRPNMQNSPQSALDHLCLLWFGFVLDHLKFACSFVRLEQSFELLWSWLCTPLSEAQTKIQNILKYPVDKCAYIIQTALKTVTVFINKKREQIAVLKIAVSKCHVNCHIMLSCSSPSHILTGWCHVVMFHFMSCCHVAHLMTTWLNYVMLSHVSWHEFMYFKFPQLHWTMS